MITFTGLQGKVSFIQSFSEDQRYVLLKRAVTLVYTPSNEHFGIGPLEGMYLSSRLSSPPFCFSLFLLLFFFFLLGCFLICVRYASRPVIAVNSGGPLETIQHNVTGFLWYSLLFFLSFPLFAFLSSLFCFLSPLFSSFLFSSFLFSYILFQFTRTRKLCKCN